MKEEFIFIDASGKLKGSVAFFKKMRQQDVYRTTVIF